MTTTGKKRGRPQKQSQTLNRDTIINTAKTMMADGGNIPSIRAIAKALGVDAMALYYYFENKAMLLEGVTTSLISDIYTPEITSDWQVELNKLAKSYLTLLKKYDGLLETLLSMQSDSPAEAFIHKFSSVVSVLGLSPDKEKVFLDLLVDYLHGFSIAMSCDKKGLLTLQHIDKPLTLLFNSILHTDM